MDLSTECSLSNSANGFSKVSLVRRDRLLWDALAKAFILKSLDMSTVNLSNAVAGFSKVSSRTGDRRLLDALSGAAVQLSPKMVPIDLHLCLF